MRPNFLTIVCLLLITYMGNAQALKLPIKLWPAATGNIAILFISGDGGLGGFSNSLCQVLSKEGHYITALDAKKYFWVKKSPDQTVKDITSLLTENGFINKFQEFVVIGYSFGADVVPFVVNKMPLAIKSKMKTVVLLSPSATTDFEIHISDWLGVKQKRSMDVVSEINRMTVQKVVTVFGSKENEFPLNNIRLKNHSNEVLPGGHHFDDNIGELAKTIGRYI